MADTPELRKISVANRLFTVPASLTDTEIDQLVESEILPFIQQHEERTGLIPAAKQAFQQGLGAIQVGAGSLAELAGMRKPAQDWTAAGVARQQAADAIAEPTSEADIAALKQDYGKLGELYGEARQEATEPLGQFIGRAGPLVGSMLAGPLPAAAGLGAEYLAQTGEMRERGVTPGTAAAAAVPMTALNLVGLPASPVTNLASRAMGLGALSAAGERGIATTVIGGAEKAAQEFTDKGLADLAALGETSALKEASIRAGGFEAGTKAAELEAAKYPTERTMGQALGQFAAHTAGMAAANIPTDIGAEALARYIAGQTQLSPSEMGDIAKQDLILSPFLGAFQTKLHDPVADRFSAAQQAVGEYSARPEIREAIAKLPELQRQEIVQSTPFHPERTAEQMWADIKASKPYAPDFTDLTPEQQQTFTEAMAARTPTRKTDKGYEPHKNLVTAFDRIAPDPAIAAEKAKIDAENAQREAKKVAELTPEAQFSKFKDSNKFTPAAITDLKPAALAELNTYAGKPVTVKQFKNVINTHLNEMAPEERAGYIYDIKKPDTAPSYADLNDIGKQQVHTEFTSTETGAGKAEDFAPNAFDRIQTAHNTEQPVPIKAVKPVKPVNEPINRTEAAKNLYETHMPELAKSVSFTALPQHIQNTFRGHVNKSTTPDADAIQTQYDKYAAKKAAEQPLTPQQQYEKTQAVIPEYPKYENLAPKAVDLLNQYTAANTATGYGRPGTINEKGIKAVVAEHYKQRPEDHKAMLYAKAVDEYGIKNAPAYEALNKAGQAQADYAYTTSEDIYGRPSTLNRRGVETIVESHNAKKPTYEIAQEQRDAEQEQKAAQSNGTSGKQSKSSKTAKTTAVSGEGIPESGQGTQPEAVAETGKEGVGSRSLEDITDRLSTVIENIGYINKTPNADKSELPELENEKRNLDAELRDHPKYEAYLHSKFADFKDNDLKAYVKPIVGRPDPIKAKVAQKILDARAAKTSPTAEPPTAEPPTAEPPTAEPPTAEPPTAEPPAAEPPAAEPPAAEPPAAEPPAAEPPAAEPTAETPPERTQEELHAEHARLTAEIAELASEDLTESATQTIAAHNKAIDDLKFERDQIVKELKKRKLAPAPKNKPAAKPKPRTKKQQAADAVATAVDNHVDNPTDESAASVVNAITEQDKVNHETSSEPVTPLGKAVHTGDTNKVIEHFSSSNNPVHRIVAGHINRLKGALTVEVGDEQSHYNRNTHTVHINRQDIDNSAVVEHEIAHAAISHSIDNPTKTQIPAVDGLKALYTKVRDDDRLAGYRGIDDIHEFVSEGLSNPEFQNKLQSIPHEKKTAWGTFTTKIAELLGIKTPEAHNAFLELVHHAEALTPKTGKARVVDAAKFFAKSPEAKSLLDAGYTTMRDEVPEQDKRSWVEKAVTKYIDKGYGLTQALAPHLPEMVGGKLRADLLYRHTAQIWNVINAGRLMGAPQLEKDGTTGLKTLPYTLHNGKRVNASLAEMQRVADTVPDGRKLVGEIAYILDTRGQLNRDASKVGSHITDDMATFRQREAEAAKVLKEHPELQDVLNMWREINHSLIDYSYNTGLIDDKTRDIFKHDPNYMPRYTLREDVMSATGADDAQGRKGGYTVDNHYVKTFRERTASEHETNPWENMARHYASVTLGGTNNIAKRAAAEQLMMAQQAAGVSDTIEPAKKNGNFAVLEDGKRKFYKLDDPDMVPAMMAVQQELGSLVKLGRGATRVLRAGVLNTPAYWARQIIRDPIYASMVSDVGWITPAHTMHELTRIREGKSAEYDLLKKRGVVSHVDPIMSPADASAFAKDIGKTKVEKGAVGKATGAFGRSLENVHAAIDGATRVAIYKAALKKAFKQGKRGEDAINYAVMKARESLNFSVRGSSTGMETARALVPFLSATLQGLETFRRAAMGTNIPLAQRVAARRSFAAKAATVGMLTAGYTLMMMDDEKYNDYSDIHTKYGSFLFPTGNDKHPFIPMPLAPEVALFKWPIEMMLNYTYGQETGSDVAKAALSELGALTPSVIPQSVRPALELMTNYSFHTGEPIESVGERGYAVRERGRHASEGAKLLADNPVAEALGMSPSKIDYLARSVAGDAGRAALGLIGMALGNEPDKPVDWAKLPIIGAGSFVSPAYGSRSRDDFYDAKAEADQARQTFNMLKETQPQSQKFKDYLSDREFMRKVTTAKMYDNVAKQISNLSKREAMIMNNPSLSVEVKEQRSSEIRNQINKMTQNFMKRQKETAQ